MSATFRLRSACVVLAFAALSTSCKSGTFVLVEMSGSVTGIDHIDLALTLDGQSASTTIRPKSSIALPTSAVLEIEKGDGDLAVTASAYSGATLVAEATGHVAVVRDKSVSLALSFGASPQQDLGDAASDLHVSDLAATDLGPADLSLADLAATFEVDVTKTSVSLGTGTVTSNVGGIDCGSACTAHVPNGTSVSLSATPGPSSAFTGWSGACSGNGSCTVTSAATVGATFRGTNTNVMFVTSTTYKGNQLDGLGGADAICVARAVAGNLGGTRWTAFLSTSTVDASSRLVTAAGTAARGWVRPDGKPFADVASDVFSHRITYYPPAMDELGAVHHGTLSSGDYAWTGTLTTGAKAAQTCSDWTTGPSGDAGYYGAPSFGSPNWISLTLADCASTDLRLYCFETDYSNAVTVTKETGRLVFLSDGFAVASGRDVADTQCQNAATGANLPGTYLALLPTTETSAISRFTTTGTTGWVRPDGVRVTATDADLFTSGGTLLAPPMVTANLDYTVASGMASGVASTIMDVGTPASDCNDYSATGSTVRFGFPTTTDVDSLYTGGGSPNCHNTFAATLCLEQ